MKPELRRRAYIEAAELLETEWLPVPVDRDGKAVRAFIRTKIARMLRQRAKPRRNSIEYARSVAKSNLLHGARMISCQKCGCGRGKRRGAGPMSEQWASEFMDQHAGHAMTISYIDGRKRKIDDGPEILNPEPER
jgi:hypothetical protein